jgi:hypothetical protein
MDKAIEAFLVNGPMAAISPRKGLPHRDVMLVQFQPEARQGVDPEDTARKAVP